MMNNESVEIRKYCFAAGRISPFFFLYNIFTEIRDYGSRFRLLASSLASRFSLASFRTTGQNLISHPHPVERSSPFRCSLPPNDFSTRREIFINLYCFMVTFFKVEKTSKGSEIAIPSMIENYRFLTVVAKI